MHHRWVEVDVDPPLRFARLNKICPNFYWTWEWLSKIFLLVAINKFFTLVLRNIQTLFILINLQLFHLVSACSETLTNKSGYFLSPSYPGHSPYDILCSWVITVPPRLIINLQFQEFRLRDHPTCDKCFVEVFDGSERTSLGKFCGYLFPPNFLSSSNHLTVLLSCQGNLPLARFKALYHSVSGTWKSYYGFILYYSVFVVILLAIC